MRYSYSDLYNLSNKYVQGYIKHSNIQILHRIQYSNKLHIISLLRDMNLVTGNGSFKDRGRLY